MQSTAGYPLPQPYVIIYATYRGDTRYSSIQRSEGLTVYSGKVIVTSQTLLCSPYVLVNGEVRSGNTLTCTVHIPGGATGNVAFSTDGAPWMTSAINGNGDAIATGGLPGAAPGVHTIQAAYSGDSNFGPFTTVTSETIAFSPAQPPSMSVGCTPASVTVGQNGTCTVEITGGAEGYVDLYVHDQFAATLTLDLAGKAVSPALFQTLPVGTYGVTAVFRGDKNYEGASAATTVSVTGGTADPQVALACSPQALSPGQATDCTATLPAGATGNILFYVDQTYVATVPLDPSSKATATGLLSHSPVGSHSVTMYYPGDSNFSSSNSGGTTVSIDPVLTAPPISVSCSPAPLVVGSATTCTANVGGGATGVVLLDINGPVVAGLGVDASGTVRFDHQLAGAAAGNYYVRATYLGDQNFAAAPATTIVPVGTAPVTPSMTVAVNPAAVRLGDQTRASAHLGGGATGYVDISSQVNIGDPTGFIARIPVSPTGDIAYAVGTSAGLGDRVYIINFDYSGDANFLPLRQSALLDIREDAPPQPGPPPPTPPGPPSGTNIYSYSITQPDGSTTGFAPNGNVIASTDSVNGQWSASYDGLDRLVGAKQAQVGGVPQLAFSNAMQQYFCWNYDSFGNRLVQAASDQSFASGSPCAPQSSASLNITSASYSGKNQITSATGAPDGYVHDNAGNVIDDGVNRYLYDAEGRLCASSMYLTGSSTGYLYNAEGLRVAKGILTSFSCDLSVNGFNLTQQYILGPNGEQMTELDSQGRWVHTNVFADGQLIATYQNDGKGVHFQFSDWLGSRRVQTDYAGNVEVRCSGGSFGDALNCVPARTGSAFCSSSAFAAPSQAL